MYLFHSDPGHGWLQVNRLELMDLGILDKISHYSYQYGGDVYLEEDCDYSLFMHEMRSRGKEVKITELVSKYDDSIIRSYEGFKL